ncbi:hypothetical protein FACS1894204_06200 [Synergistales bacterium]|nr:hypothetical protein FACS1894204_06200 [Synergistales bacterium]
MSKKKEIFTPSADEFNVNEIVDDDEIVDVKVDEKTGLVEMRVMSDSSETDEFNNEERKVLGDGFTTGRTFRKVANIDDGEFNALMMLGDKLCLDFAASNYSDAGILRRLLYLHPDWRASEGSV